MSAASLIPHDHSVEAGVLGAMMLDRDACDLALSRLRPDDFYAQRHSEVFAVFVDMAGQGEVIELLNVANKLRTRYDALWLRGLTEEVTTAAAMPQWVEMLKDMAFRRRMLHRAYALQNSLTEGPSTDALGALLDTAMTDPSFGFVTIGQALTSAADRAELLDRDVHEGRIVRTGFKDLDARLIGLLPGRLVLVAARPGVGKSALVQNLLLHAAVKQGRTAALFTLEMDKAEVGLRIASQLTEVPHTAMMRGAMLPRHWEELLAAVGLVEAAPLFIQDRADLTPGSLQAELRRLRQRDVAVVAVDYVGLMHTGSRPESRQQEVADISRALKALARDLKCCVIGVVQLNRNLESRKDKTPQLSDLRESGALEADADVVILMHRDREDEGMVHLEIAKNRSGETGQVSLYFDGAHMRFRDVGPNMVPPVYGRPDG